jgi:hypothetical protein
MQNAETNYICAKLYVAELQLTDSQQSHCAIAGAGGQYDRHIDCSRLR